ncbi:hypothetical protein B9G53_16720 [Pseudanabaena sp. SR411]|uniref:SpoIIE family protein phosphatase n=1 Tax=Pseudanabaena sp. SR411 TaxID=1980935 RepID=UPI000B9833A8|nr:SpoIIE family protein phosphatase [Pseudanabaena sp. SR411]OYQ63494.1 hypothetical protein B9G53_16720 [Pseudanabaena sp. SR411]
MSSIRQVFPIVVSLQITVAVGLTGWISFVSSEKAVQKLTRELCENLNDRVEEKINAYLSESVWVNQATAIALSNGAVNPNNLEQVQRDIFNKVKELNTQNILFFGNENGTMVGIEHRNNSKFLLRIREDNNNPNRPTYELNNNGSRGKVIANEIYDHRTRPWYIAAKQSGKAIWSSIFVSTTDGELSTTRATPIYTSEGNLQGVVGINVSLKQISQYILETRPTDQWHVFVVESNGRLVASTSSSPMFEKEGTQVKRFEAAQSKDLKLQKAALAIQNQLGGFTNLKDSRVIEFDFNGETYIASADRINQNLDLDWSVGIIVPKAIFMKEIDDNSRTTVVIIILSLLTSILILIYIIRRQISVPLDRLMGATEVIAKGNFDIQLDVSRQDELGRLAYFFNHMSQQLQESFHKLEKTNEELEIRVDQRTHELKKAKEQAEEANKLKSAFLASLTLELEKGREMQLNFLPPELLEIPNWEISAFFKPARQVAGDFYDTFPVLEKYVGLVIADVCDKGVGAALFMALFRSLIRIFASQTAMRSFYQQITLDSSAKFDQLTDSNYISELTPINVLESVALTNDYVAEHHGDLGMFATLFFGVLDPLTGILYYINGGHEPLFIINSEGEILQKLNSTGPAVGMMPNMKFKVEQAHLKSGDILVGYTDGVTEARALGGEFFSDQRLLNILTKPVTSVSHLLNEITKNVINHIGGADQFDDITLLAIQRH